jgi:regulatory protein YycI of two-component signal transduction system YycFG
MPIFAIARTAKQKGGSVASSGHHNDRTRETLNADPDRKDQNRVLIGDDRNVRELVTEVIHEHGGKPRSDSVEAVEMVLTATHAFFTAERGGIDHEKVEKFVDQAKAFLNDPRSGGICVKAVLHMDERTPHVQAHKVPIDPNRKLNCKHYFGGREKMEAYQDLYHAYMEPLGLERGERGSRARHTDIQKFYAAITQEHELKINYDRLPDPPIFRGKEGIKKYKKEVVKAINQQVKEPLKTLHHQAMLSREEAAKREAAEKLAEERVQAAERTKETAMKQNTVLSQDNQNLRATLGMAVEANRGLKKELDAERVISTQRAAIAISYKERLTDIPVHEVMKAMNYGDEQQDGHYVYRNSQQQVVLAVNEKNELISRDGVICNNSFDAVMHMKNVNEKKDWTQHDALHFLAENFGSSKAVAALLVKQEGRAVEHIKEWSLEQERASLTTQQSLVTAERDLTLDRDTMNRGGFQQQMDLPQHDEPDHDFGFSR